MAQSQVDCHEPLGLMYRIVFGAGSVSQSKEVVEGYRCAAAAVRVAVAGKASSWRRDANCTLIRAVRHVLPGRAKATQSLAIGCGSWPGGSPERSRAGRRGATLRARILARNFRPGERRTRRSAARRVSEVQLPCADLSKLAGSAARIPGSGAVTCSCAPADNCSWPRPDAARHSRP